MKDQNQSRIKETVRLIKLANCSHYAAISELAKELGEKKTELMAHIDRHPELFITREGIRGQGGRAGNTGLLILDVFESAEENYTREEFLKKRIEEYRDTLYVDSYSEYGQLMARYIEKDVFFHDPKPGDDHRLNYPYWRNTVEKMGRFEKTGHFHKGNFWGGGDGRACYERDHIVNDDDLRALIKEGWKLIGDVPEEIKKLQNN